MDVFESRLRAPRRDAVALALTERLLDASEVGERLSVPETWVRQEAREGRMPCLRLGRYVRFEWLAVVEWLEEQRAGRWRKYQPKAPA